MINGEKSKGIWDVRVFLFFEDSLITESIAWWNASQDCRPLHFPNDDRGLVQMTGSGTGRGSPAVWTIYFLITHPVFSARITGCFIMNIAIRLRNDEAFRRRKELIHFTCMNSFSSVNHLQFVTGQC